MARRNVECVLLPLMLALVVGTVAQTNTCPKDDVDQCPDISAMIAIQEESKLPEWVGWKRDCSCYCKGNNTLWAEAKGTYSCDPLARVTAIKLNGKLFGSPLPPSLIKLPSLKDLDLANNMLTQTLPAVYSNMTQLQRLVLTGRDQKLEGSIPETWSTLTGLQVLELSGLDLSAPLPASFTRLRNLNNLTLSSCNMTGVDPVITKLVNISNLDLSGNNMTINGMLPLEFTKMSTLRRLSLTNNKGVNGTIPDQYSTLTFLKALEITKVSHATIPRWFSTMTSLQNLTIADSQLTGPLPDWLPQMKSLQLINLEDNKLNGSLPLWLTSLGSLKHVHLARNRLAGVLPEQYSSMSQLQTFDVSVNSLDGTIYSSWGNLTNLQTLKLSQNHKLGGELPSSWGKLEKVQLLWLLGTRVGGNLPNEWSTMVKMKELLIYNASLSGTLPAMYSHWADGVDTILLHNNNLNGTLPASWSKFNQLRQLGLADNKLEGPLPDGWAGMSGMQNLFFQNNMKLNGSFPLSWGFNMTQIKFLQFQNNSFSGEIPLSWSMLQQIQSVDMSSNNFSGTVPIQWSTMKDIQLMSLYNNSLEGTLPATWSTMKNIRLLSLQMNRVSGELPSSWSEMSQLKKLDVSSNKLNGSMPKEWKTLTGMQMLDVSNNNIQGNVPSEWAGLKSLTYLGLQRNEGLCQSADCLSMMTGTGWNLSYVSVQGGGNIPTQWCDNTPLSKDGRLPQLLFVGDEPKFDTCMEKICVAEFPESYKFRYVRDFNLYQAQYQVNGSASDVVMQQFSESTLDGSVVDSGVEARLKIALSDMDALIDISGEGWKLGSQNWYDPCIDRLGVINTIVMFGLFAAAVAIILWDWVRQRRGKDGVVAIGTKLLASFMGHKNTEAAIPQEEVGASKDDLKSTNTSSLTSFRTRVWLQTLITLHMYMTPYMSTAWDIISDLVLIRELYPNWTSTLMIIAFLVTDWICASVVYLRLYQHQQTRLEVTRSIAARRSDETAEAMETDSKLVRKMFQVAMGLPGLQGILVRSVMAVLLIPVFSITMHVTAAILAAIVLISLMKQQHKYTWNFLGLDVQKTVIFRSFVVGLIEAPVAIIFTSWAYLVPKKYLVGHYISRTAFFINLASSMFHVVLTLWELKHVMLHNDHDVRKSLREISDLEMDKYKGGVAGAATNAAAGADVSKDVEGQ